MPAVLWFIRRLQPAEAAESARVARGHEAALFNHVVEPIELLDAYRGLQIGHAVVVPDAVVALLNHLSGSMPRQIGNRHCMLPQTTQSSCDPIVGGCDHAAFAGAQNFAWVKA